MTQNFKDDTRPILHKDLTVKDRQAVGVWTAAMAFTPWFLMRDIPGQRIEIPGGQGHGMFIRDPSLSHAYRKDTVSEHLLGLMTFLGLPCLIALETCSPGNPQRWRAAYVWAKALLINEVLTTVFKCYCGVLRPNFYETCEWQDDQQHCANDNPLTGRVSFPSGHSSTSACAATLVTLHVLRQIDLRLAVDAVEDIAVGLLKFFAHVPPLLAMFTAFSRVHDNKHHPADVVAGAMLGTTIAALSHRLAFAGKMPTTSAAAAAHPQLQARPLL